MSDRVPSHSHRSATQYVTTSDGVRIAWDSAGVGPDVVLVHGLTDDRSTWGAVADRLAQDHRIIRLDLRGHGESGDSDDYGALSMASDVAAVMAAASVAQPVLIGHSLGGMVATAVAAQLPVRAVLNVDQPLRLSDFKAGLAMVESLLLGTDEEFSQGLAAIFDSMRSPGLTAEVQEMLDGHRARARRDVVLGVWTMIFAATAAELDEVVESLLPAIGCPYLTLLGADPGSDYIDWSASLLPDSRVEVWPGEGHYLHLADVDRFVAVARSMLG